MILSLASFSIVYVATIMMLILLRQEKQPLKIKSPRLMLLCIFANLTIIISVSVVQLSEEKCINEDGGTTADGVCKWHVLEMFSLCFGYILLGFTEPLSVIAYVLRSFRLRSIYDAQLTYYSEDRKPVEMIEKFRELRLIKVTAISVGCLTVVYLVTALFLKFVPMGSTTKLYLLPSMDTASFVKGSEELTVVEAQANFNEGMDLSMYFLIWYYFAEGCVFLWAMHRVRDFQEDFNLMGETKRYALAWLAFSNLVLFLCVQGSYSGFLTLQQINRYKTVLYILRSLVAASICGIPPLIESYRDASFFQIPPNRESI